MSEFVIQLPDPKELMDQRREVRKALIKIDAMLRALGVDVPEYDIPNARLPRQVEAGEFVLTAAIREACEKLASDFTKHDVAAYIEEKYPDESFNPGSISSCLPKLAKKKLIRETKKGIGGKSSVYEWLNSAAEEKAPDDGSGAFPVNFSNRANSPDSNPGDVRVQTASPVRDSSNASVG